MQTAATIATVTIAALLAACASNNARSDSYDAWLAQWQGASEQALLARFGPPNAEEQVSPTSKRMTYVLARPGAYSAGPTIGLSIGGFGIGGGGRTAVGGAVGVTAPLSTTPATCTTTFVLEEGKVVSWASEGPAC